jgi:hypothetical protein
LSIYIHTTENIVEIKSRGEAEEKFIVKIFDKLPEWIVVLV